MKRAVIIVAGGSGLRMGGDLPKQFLDLKGKPLVIHTLERFLQFDPKIEVVLVMAPQHREFWDSIINTYEFASRIGVTFGGITRYDSVKNGLECVGDGLVVGIHDAVRPFVSQNTLNRTYAAAAEGGSGIPVVEMDESVRMVESQGHSVHMDRSRLKRVQTPQVFKSELIREAYAQPFDSAFTDDASVYESKFSHITLVEGNRQNIKITTPTDMKVASVLIQSWV